MAFDRYRQEGSVAFVADRLRSLLGPWTHELNDLHLPWGRAIAKVCSSQIEQLLRVSALSLVSSVGDAGLESLQAAGGGRCMAGTKLDQLVEVINRLDPILTEKIKTRYAPLRHRNHLLSSHDARLLRCSSKMSNAAFAHRANTADQNQQALQLLSCAQELCRSRLVAAARAIEAKNLRPKYKRGR